MCYYAKLLLTMSIKKKIFHKHKDKDKDKDSDKDKDKEKDIGRDRDRDRDSDRDTERESRKAGCTALTIGAVDEHWLRLREGAHAPRAVLVECDVQRLGVGIDERRGLALAPPVLGAELWVALVLQKDLDGGPVHAVVRQRALERVTSAVILVVCKEGLALGVHSVRDVLLALLEPRLRQPRELRRLLEAFSRFNAVAVLQEALAGARRATTQASPCQVTLDTTAPARVPQLGPLDNVAHLPPVDDVQLQLPQFAFLLWNQAD